MIPLIILLLKLLYLLIKLSHINSYYQQLGGAVSSKYFYMWKYNQQKILNLLTRKQYLRLVDAHTAMNPALIPFLTKNTEDYHQMSDRLYEKIQTQLQPYYNSHIYKRNAQELQQKTKPQKNSNELSRLNAYLRKTQTSLDIPSLQELEQYLFSRKTQAMESWKKQLEYVSKFIHLRLRKSSNIEDFIKEQCYNLLESIEHALLNLQQGDDIDRSQNIYRLMLLYRRMNQQSIEGALQQEIQWTFKYAQICYQVKSFKQSLENFIILYEQAQSSQEIKTYALRKICGIYQMYRNIGELKDLLKDVQGNNQQYFEIVKKSIENICDNQLYTHITSVIQLK